jgi:hypothetical protein
MSHASIRTKPRAVALRVWRGNYIAALRQIGARRLFELRSIQDCLRPNVHPRQGMKKSKNVQQPQNCGDHHHGVQK